MARLRAGEAAPLWVAARRQTEGRGRRGSPWQSLEGNLLASLGLVSKAEPRHLATLGFVAGLALAQALESCCGCAFVPAVPIDGGAFAGGQGRFALKWPNDVLVDGAKLSGILLETEATPDGARILVIGIGVNVASAPQGLPYPVASLHALGYPVQAADLLAALSAEWVELFGIWSEGRGFAAIRRLWLQRAAGLGHDIVVRSGAEALRGTFETLDDSGQLIIRLAGGASRAVAAGDVHFGGAATLRPERIA